MNSDVLTCRAVVRQRVVLPVDNSIGEKFQFVVARGGSLVDLEGELMQFATHIVHSLRAGELHGLAIYGDYEERSASCYALRQHYGAELALCLLRNDACARGTARRSDGTVAQIDGASHDDVLHQDVLLHIRPFPFGKAVALNERHLNACHDVAMLEDDSGIRGSDVFGFRPKEVALLVAAHLLSVLGVALVALHGERLLGDAGELGDERIVAIHVYRGLVVLPIELVGTCPLVLIVVVGEAYVVGMVARKLQKRCRSLVLIVHHEHTNLVAISKAVVVGARHVLLLYIRLQLQRFPSVGAAIAGQLIRTGSQQGKGSHQSNTALTPYYIIYSVCFHNPKH